jgi:undecaprenyl-diphosphatase
MVGVVAVARVYVGAHLPVDALGGAALGWMVGAAFHLLWGAPGGAPSSAAVRSALEDAGLQPVEVTPAVLDARGSTPFLVKTATGAELFVKAVGRAQRDADLLFKGWRYLALRHIEDESPFATAKQQIEHEAYLSLLAARAGVSVPDVVTAPTAAGGAALLVETRLAGRGLDVASADMVDDEFLRSIWGQVAKLRAARIAHRDLRLANVVDVDGQPWIIDFGFAQAAASERRLAQDVAELLASLSCIVGAERAVTTAAAVLGSQAVATSVPFLQPLALSAVTRHDLSAHPGLLKELREVAARHGGVETPEVEPLTRVRPRTALLILGFAFALHLLLPQVGELRQTLDALGSARWGWLAVGLLASVATYLAAAVAQLGAVAQPLALGRTAAVQLASSFTNRLTPANLGGAGLNIRFLERSGLERSEAVGAVALNSAAGAIVHILALVLTAATVGRSGVRDVNVPKGWPVLIAVIAVLVIAGAVLWSPLGHRRIVMPVLRTGRKLVEVVRRPAKALQLFGGSAAITTAYILALAAALEAFGAHVGLAKVTLVYLGGSALGAVSPTPGGLGVVEAGLVAGLTAVGAAPGPSIAGVLGFRLLTFWLPVLPGWFVFRGLERRGVI